MDTRPFGTRSGLKVAPVSIGAMRLPRDTDEAVALVRRAIDGGMRYIDTSRGYGESEWLIGRALRDGYRKKVMLSTKWGPWVVKIRPDDVPTADCVRRRIDESLKRLDVPYVDFYQVWSVCTPEQYAQATGKNGMLAGIRKAMREGLVRHAGFTTHDSVENLLGYIGKNEWFDVILLTYNILNRTYAPVLRAARESGMGTIVMNPVGGGRFTGASRVFDPLVRACGARSLADLAVRYVLSNPHVDTILCGISKDSDVDDTIASSERPGFDPGTVAKIEAFADRLLKKKERFCTACRYCMPCPQGINIPAVMGAVFERRVLGLADHAARAYAHAGERKADACSRCGRCETKCTQKLPVMREMAYAARVFKAAAKAS